MRGGRGVLNASHFLITIRPLNVRAASQVQPAERLRTLTHTHTKITMQVCSCSGGAPTSIVIHIHV